MQHTNGESEALLDQIQARLADEKDLIANIATCTALLFEGMEAVDWVGVYFLRDGELILGPFQGRAARSRVTLSQPVAGRAAREGRAIIIDDMTSLTRDEDDFPARSQIAVPVLLQGRVVGVIQVDSPFMNRFNAEDQNVLERACALLLDSSNTTGLLPRRSNNSRKKVTSRTEARKPAEIEGVTAERAPVHPPHVSTMSYNGSTVTGFRRRPWQMSKRALARRAIAVIVAGIFFGWALSGNAYDVIPSGTFDYHVLLRKLYTIPAFVIIGFCFSLGWRSSIRLTILSIAIYSAAIEVGQTIVGAHEGLLANIFAVLCGAIGAYLGAAVRRAYRRKRSVSQF